MEINLNYICIQSREWIQNALWKNDHKFLIIKIFLSEVLLPQCNRLLRIVNEPENGVTGIIR